MREDGSYEDILGFCHWNLLGKSCAMLFLISTAIIQLCQTNEKNDSDGTLIAKHISGFEQNSRLRRLFVWAVAHSPIQYWKLRSLTITPPSSVEMSGYQLPNKAAPRPGGTETSTTPRKKA